MSRMNAGERQALRQVVRQRMKVLRSDVAARKAEMEAEVQQRVAEKFAARDKLIMDLNDQLASIWDQAAKDARAAIQAVQKDHDDLPVKLGQGGTAPIVAADNSDKFHLGRRLHAEIERQVSAALVEIDRQEADLVEEITVDGLETEAAKNFLTRIPTVGQLVPTARLMEIAG